MRILIISSGRPSRMESTVVALRCVVFVTLASRLQEILHSLEMDLVS